MMRKRCGNARSWWIFINISLFIHAVFISGIPEFLKGQMEEKYQGEKGSVTIYPEEITKISTRTATDEKMPIPPRYIDNSLIDRVLIDRPEPIKPGPNISRYEERIKKVILSDIPKDEKLKELPEYMNYYRKIRETIQKKAYNNYKINDEGEVFASFIIGERGELIRLSIDESYSTTNKKLTNIAENSIKEIFPFEPFPAELDYPRLQFNVSIYFKSD